MSSFSIIPTKALPLECAESTLHFPGPSIPKKRPIKTNRNTIIFCFKKIPTILRIAPQMAYVLNWPLTLPVTLSTCNYKQISPQVLTEFLPDFTVAHHTCQKLTNKYYLFFCKTPRQMCTSVRIYKLYIYIYTKQMYRLLQNSYNI